MSGHAEIGGFCGIGGGLVLSILQWIYYWYMDVTDTSWVLEMNSWWQSGAYVIIIAMSFVLWLLMDNCLRNNYSSRGNNYLKFTLGIVFGFSGGYTLFCWIYASYILKIILGIILFVLSWWACLYFQDDISRYLQ
eukprot:454451_1